MWEVVSLQKTPYVKGTAEIRTFELAMLNSLDLDMIRVLWPFTDTETVIEPEPLSFNGLLAARYIGRTR
jgi:hypothetical protein